MLLVLVVLALYQFYPGFGLHAFAEERRGGRLLDDAASLELKRQQLVEKEAALRAKEQALSRLSATLDARVIELNAAKRGIEGALVAKKKQDEDRYKKMIKIYKGLKAEEAGELLNKLEPKMVIEMLNQMDQKTAVKLIPFITQPRVLEWTRMNLAGQ
jgi:flagellar motility protein MotE (MotC chaperone)